MDVSIPYTDGLRLGAAIDARTMKPRFLLPGSKVPPTTEEERPEIMDVSIPYTDGLHLGVAIDARTMKPRLMLPGSKVPPTTEEVNNTALQYSFVSTFKDVCDVLDVPPEYALKVEADIIHNKVVSSCLKALHIKDSFTLLFRGKFEKRKHILKDRKDQSSSEESGIPSQSSLISGNYTHWVRAVEVGNEIILLVTLVSSDPDKLAKLKTKWTNCFGSSSQGSFSQDNLEDMQKVAKETDKKLSKKHYRDTKLHVGYGFFHALNSHPNTMSGAVEALENFSNQCQKWTGLCSPKQVYLFKASVMDWNIGETVTSEEISGQGAGEECITFYPRSSSRAESLDSDGDHGLVVLGPYHFYTLKVTMKALEKEDNKAENKAGHNQESTNKLYHLLISYKKAVSKLQAFLDSLDFNEKYGQSEGKKVLKSIRDTYERVLDSVRQLDMITVPDVSTMRDIFRAQSVDSLGKVDSFIEDVTTKLPPGGDLDLLLIGKTGHGKSSTGNSILGHEEFEFSADGESVTTKSGVSWAKLDNRVIKVVDTPGICDTKVLDEKEDIDLALRSFSEALEHCPDGFHALLLIIRFGTRMTDEEKNAIKRLKEVLGKDIITDYCICVITHGEDFEPAGSQTFEQWCRSQKGFLRELFQECNYRCELFKNKAPDDKAKKIQRIKLVEKVDNLKARGTRYTNSHFQLVKDKRERIQKEEKKAAASEDFRREYHLFLLSLNRIYHGKDEQEKHRYREELDQLKRDNDNLKNRISEVHDDNLNDLLKELSDLAGTIDMLLNEVDEKTANPEVSSNNNLEQHYNKLQECMKTEFRSEVEDVDEMVTKNLHQKMKDEGTSCFPGCSQVRLKDGRCITLQHLKIGDQVLVRDSKGHLMYDTVYMFGHCDDEAYTSFIVLKTGETGNVRVSSQHYVFCKRDGVELCMTAEEVRVGDELLRLVSRDSTALEAVCVQGKRAERLQGLFAPFTMKGTIVVDDHLMSCYVQCVSHNTSHLLLGPVRQLYKISPNALAFVNNLGQLQDKTNIPWWGRLAFKVLKG